jgi:hypothetical protein
VLCLTAKGSRASVEYEIALTGRNAQLGSRYRITRYESSRTTTADIVECRRVTTLSSLALGEATGGSRYVTVVLCGINSVGRCLDQPALCPTSYAGKHRQVRSEGVGLTETLAGTPGRWVRVLILQIPGSPEASRASVNLYVAATRTRERADRHIT